MHNVLFAKWNYIFVQFLDKYVGAKGTGYAVCSTGCRYQHCYTLINGRVMDEL